MGGRISICIVGMGLVVLLSACGQENAESRKSFHYLFTHFVEDFTHYDNAFWKTIQYLLFRPSRLTREYLSGKRKKYVAPVKLYIFISFITFLMISLFPANINEKIDKSETVLNKDEYQKNWCIWHMKCSQPCQHVTYLLNVWQ